MDHAALALRLDGVLARVDGAAAAAGRDPSSITTIVVTKFQPPALIAALLELGVRDFGESRHPEARDKAEAFPAAHWHFIGQLQTNKARQVARYASIVHSVDRDVLVDALAAGEHALPVLLQIDLDPEPDAGRGGIAPTAVEALAERVLTGRGLTLAGVMTVAPPELEPLRAFARLREVADRVRRLAPDATVISAGMSGDFEAAIREGATHLRIGGAITGPRPARP